ncbi:MAG TPA: FliM/FliN family flagellar motor switch protein [Solirubrobacteraceae bacterium]|nr:FliM/FliN family flagellar motor switch protein [Solirubrobacteraceae bacterium]
MWPTSSARACAAKRCCSRRRTRPPRDQPYPHDDPRDAGARPLSIVTLNRLSGEPVDLLVNGKPIARGEVVVIDEESGLRVTEVVAGETADAAAPVAEPDIPAPVPAPTPQT